jgi:hypothetical protein
LLGWLGPVWLGALSIVATALVAVPLLRDAVHPRAGAIGFVVAAALDVASGRTTFAVGAVVALAAVLAAERRRPIVVLVVAGIATVTSPVAGFLLLVVAVALLLTDAERRSCGVALVVGVVVPLGGLAWLARGDTRGYEPFTRSSLLMAVGTALVVAIVPAGRRVRAGAAVAIVVLFAAYFVHSPVGANATRIAVLAAAPTVIAATRFTDQLLVAGATVVAALLPLAQLHNDLSASRVDDTSRQFVAPLLHQLAVSAVQQRSDGRVELVDTATHWASTYLLPHVSLARGWERQVDESRNPLFYGRAPLDAVSYRRFLDRNAVGVVAVATGVPLDYGATRESRLIAAGLPYLHLRWSDTHWRVYDVTRPAALVQRPAVVVDGDDTGVTFTVPAAGRFVVRVRWSPYLVVEGGQVSKAADDDVAVVVPRAGTYRLHAQWRL